MSFCEKPLALTSEDAEAIIRAAAARAWRRRWAMHLPWPEYQELVSFMQSQRAGKLLSLNLTRRAGRLRYSAGNGLLHEKRSLGGLKGSHDLKGESPLDARLGHWLAKKQKPAARMRQVLRTDAARLLQARATDFCGKT